MICNVAAGMQRVSLGNWDDSEQSREDDDQEVVEIEDEKNGPKDRVRVIRDA